MRTSISAKWVLEPGRLMQIQHTKVDYYHGNIGHITPNLTFFLTQFHSDTMNAHSDCKELWIDL